MVASVQPDFPDRAHVLVRDPPDERDLAPAGAVGVVGDDGAEDLLGDQYLRFVADLEEPRPVGAATEIVLGGDDHVVLRIPLETVDLVREQLTGLR